MLYSMNDTKRIDFSYDLFLYESNSESNYID